VIGIEGWEGPVGEPSISVSWLITEKRELYLVSGMRRTFGIAEIRTPKEKRRQKVEGASNYLGRARENFLTEASRNVLKRKKTFAGRIDHVYTR